MKEPRLLIGRYEEAIVQRTEVFGFGACALSLGVLVSGSGCSSPDAAQAAQELERGDLAAELRGCSEYVGLRGTPVARVRALVPARYSIIGEGAGQATVIVRAFQCANVSVDEGPGEPGAVAHVGVLIDSPDGDGVLNFATLSYATDLPRLHASLNVVGARARLVENLEYVFSDPEGTGSGTIEVDVPPPSELVFELHGLAVSPDPTQPGVNGNFNWYDGDDERVVALKTYFPDVRLGGGLVTLQTDPESPLAAVLGASSSQLELGFDFEYRGLFDEAYLSVTASPSL